MSPRFPVVPKRRDTLYNIATPESAAQPECLAWALYDTQSLTTAVTTTLTFFGATNTDQTLTNMESSGQLPDPQFFEVWFMGAEFQFPAVSTSAAVAGNLTDLLEVIYHQRATFELNLSNKKYGPWPLSMAHGNGGATGYVSSTVATSSQQFGQNGVEDGGYWVGGQIVLPPKVGFNVTVRLAGAATLTLTPLPIRFSLIGVLHHRVL